MNRVTQRDFLVLCGLVSMWSTLVACGATVTLPISSSTPSPQVTANTSAAVVPTTLATTPTAILLIMPTATSLPTPTNQPTRTNTPIPPTETATSTSIPPTQTAKPTETPKMPALSINGSRFVSDGKEAVLRGAVVSNFAYDTPGYLNSFQGDIDTLQKMGANFISVQWNSGYFDNLEYTDKLMSGLKYARGKGFRIELVFHSRGYKDMGGWLQELQPEIVDESIKNDWNVLLAVPGMSQALADTVDIFNPLSEPQKDKSGNYMTLPEWSKQAIDILNLIRLKTSRPKAAGLISCAEFASLCHDGLNIALGPDTGFEVHPYAWTTTKEDYKGVMNQARQQGKLIVVGEFGFEDDPAFISDQVKFLTINNLNFAWSTADSYRNHKSFLFDSNRKLTANGILAQQSFMTNKP